MPAQHKPHSASGSSTDVAASQAARRQHPVDDRAAEPPQRAGDVGGESHCGIIAVGSGTRSTCFIKAGVYERPLARVAVRPPRLAPPPRPRRAAGPRRFPARGGRRAADRPARPGRTGVLRRRCRRWATAGAGRPSRGADVGFVGRRRSSADPELVPFREAASTLSPASRAALGRRPARRAGAASPGTQAGRAASRRDARRQTLVELRTALLEAELIEEGGASPRVSPAAELGDAAALLLRAGFAMPVADAEKITVTYPDAAGVDARPARHGRNQRARGAAARPLRRQTLARAAALYAERFGLPDGRIPATFEILFLTGWAPRRTTRSRARGRAGRSLSSA